MVNPGDVIARRFRIERLAGSGGMGVVFRALDLHTGEPVALKLSLSEDEQLAARFQREARALFEIQHPGVARHVDHGVDDGGRRYLVMEWLEGEDLATRLARGPIDVDEALALVSRVADALAAVHACGVVHRDLKPANLFLAGRDLSQAKILDFGVARFADGTYGLTDPGAAIGTPAYMAPEQVRGEPDIDARADIYALGCILFECLTGRPPFLAQHPVAVLAKVLFDEPVQPSLLRPGVPASVDALVARLMARDRARRPVDASAAARKIREHGAGPEGSATDAETPASVLTRNERRLVSVVLARARDVLPSSSPGGGPRDDATLDAREASSAVRWPPTLLATIRSVAEMHRARLERLRDGTAVAMLTGNGAPTDLAARAARCALAIRVLLPGAPVALATGWDVVEGTQPVGLVIERAGALLAGGDPAPTDGAPRPVLLDAMTAALLPPRFQVTGDALTQALLAEDEPGEQPRTLLGKRVPCVGRERELRILEDLFQECVNESCARAVLVTAPAGVGKSRLRLELARRLRGRGAPVELWVAHGDPLRAGGPLGLLGQVVRRAAQILDGEPIVRRREKLSSRVACSVEAADRARVAEFLGEMVGAPFPDAESVQLRAARQDPMLMGDQMRRAWVEFLGAECRARPVVLVLEDLHWGDLPTVEYTDAALRLLMDQPLLVVALARPEVRETFSGLWAERSLTELRLGELPRSACERLVRVALGEEASAAQIAEIVRRAGGNAFFLEELVRAAAEGRDASEAPETVLAMVQARLEALDAEARLVLRAGSVLGEVFWRGAVARLLGEERSSPALAARLAELERREWIARRGEAKFQAEVEYTFRHGLVREAAYAMLTEADRRLGHRLAGAWLQQSGEQDALVVAEHLERGGEREGAARHYERAAEQGLEANDLGGALERVARALACEPGREAAGRLHAVAATANCWRGTFDVAECAAKAALDLAPAGSTAHTTSLAMLAWASGSLGKGDQLEAVAARLHLEGITPRLDRELALACYSANTWLRELGRHAAAEHIEQALSVVRPEESEPGIAAHVYTMRGHAALAHRKLEQGLLLYSLAASAYEHVGNLRNSCLMRANLGGVLSYFGAYGRAAEVLEETRQKAEHLRLSYIVQAFKPQLGYIRLAQGDAESAHALLVEVVDQTAHDANPRQLVIAKMTLARILVQLQKFEEASNAAISAVGASSAYPSLHAATQAILARALLGLEREGEALEAARTAVQVDEQQGGLDLEHHFVRLTWAEALHAVGYHDAARAVIAAARERLRTEAAGIISPELRKSFLEGVPEHARIFMLADAWGAS